MPVGTGFGGLDYASTQGPRMPDNPYDRATIVSVYPKKIVDRKYCIFPGYFEIEAAPKDGFTITVVGPSSWWKQLHNNQPDLEIPTNSIIMAESFIKDYVVGLFGCNSNDTMPGLFFIPGKHDVKSILTYVDEKTLMSFKDLLAVARVKQNNYFKKLVELADILWSQTNGNPRSILPDARLAAEVLSIKNKPWMTDSTHYEMTNCKACGFMVKPEYPVCPNCKSIVNEAKAKELNLKFASI